MSTVRLWLCRRLLPADYALFTHDQADRHMGASFLLQETLSREGNEDGTTSLRFRTTDVAHYDQWEAEYNQREGEAWT